jgi:enterochelin esterase family protein
LSAKDKISKNDIWQRVRDRGAPLIEEDTVMFVWFGSQAPQLMGDFSGWEQKKPLSLVSAAKDIWVYELQVPQAAYIEYTFLDQQGERVSDPFNPNTVPNGLGDTNHYFYMPGAGPTELVRRVSGAPKGKVTRQLIQPEHVTANGERYIYLYQPPTPGPYPLLVVFDGNHYLRRVRLNVMIDNLIHQKRISPLALAMVQNHKQARFLEYACNDATLGLLKKYVLPLAKERLELLDNGTSPGSYGVMGASMGGLMALYAGIRMPEIFGSVLSQSGAFRLDNAQTVVFDLIGLGRQIPLKIWMDAGCYDKGHLVQANRDLYNLLRNRGYQAVLREYPGGHNYTAWRDDLWRGLEYLFGKS